MQGQSMPAHAPIHPFHRRPEHLAGRPATAFGPIIVSSLLPAPPPPPRLRSWCTFRLFARRANASRATFSPTEGLIKEHRQRLDGAASLAYLCALVSDFPSF